ncbi:NAD(P)-dependent dehydrogenase (short-subunit alcohol dehydrogenase family) [Streptosporangium becharense]|uniref:NAD(P)-dependent dehydrogenase (Short-subunit alcohol dehydrogenase family) n=1 Tax=Streptosporangium becharense TaxID=1816182 RepID=A0A7W9IMU8_9ACTN|nr:SDR family NAD(P)-dependent oxidoreductase [Streptosporangium becharense]MBB2914376.1 NAD(P)-dependent dehydrogenase (short-subunit alcohol dehydrogenase family) [Streptosporangium becharense]MBB5823592.1 NAD(P)-dependent dehydrogenase (short-subunit alcohol dehydrogenase family) [Streptosporangium becharense]
MSAAHDLFGGGVAVITGAGAGIGAGLARYAARELGMTVVLADVDTTAITALRTELQQQGAHALDVACDVRDPDAVERLAETTLSEAGPVRLLVNNAGVEQFGYLWDTPVANWERLVTINISGVFHGVRAFLPRMMADPGRSWVWNLSSVGGVSAGPLQAPYIMSKHAVLALTECLHQEVELAGHGHHVHVQAVLPGAVTSNIFESAGAVDDGDVTAAEDHRSAMLQIKAQAMDPLDAARVFFDQAAAQEFYLLSQPFVADAMAARADTLLHRRPPHLPRGEFSVPAP